MFLHTDISAVSAHFFETTNTMNFASKSRMVTNNPVANAVERPEPVDIRKQLELFRKLKKARDIYRNNQNATYEAISREFDPFQSIS